MSTRMFLTGVALGIALLGGGIGATGAADHNGVRANCVGRHTSHMAREHRGLATATKHHNELQGTDLTIGEHQAHVRDEACGQ